MSTPTEADLLTGRYIFGRHGDAWNKLRFADPSRPGDAKPADKLYTFIDGDADKTVLGTGTDRDDVYRGGYGDDQFFGRRGDDHLFGQNGDDDLRGGEGNDHIYGGEGSDHLDGGEGDDRIWGDEGADDFRFDAGHGHDRIFDFEPGTDSISVMTVGVAKSQIRYSDDGAGNTLVTWGVPDSGVVLVGVDAGQFT